MIATVLILSFAAYLTAASVRIARDRRQGLPDNLFRSSFPEKLFGWLLVAAFLAALISK